ncbi:unnamed protein product [Linum tenue]|uniref:Uncharacterized protein n=2 Tax=Linum tenue TaxID=586396 RepID=A0AAV0QIY5_9ROSI|nr:unnamed protein product [Linum tenue]
MEDAPTSSQYDLVVKCFGEQNHGHMTCFGGAVKPKDLKVGSSKDKGLDARLRQSEEEKVAMRKRIEELEATERDREAAERDREAAERERAEMNAQMMVEMRAEVRTETRAEVMGEMEVKIAEQVKVQVAAMLGARSSKKKKPT